MSSLTLWSAAELAELRPPLSHGTEGPLLFRCHPCRIPSLPVLPFAPSCCVTWPLLTGPYVSRL